MRVRGLLIAVVIFVGIVGALLGLSLRSYHRLTHEQVAVEIQLTPRGPQLFEARLTYPDGRTQAFELQGDEWQVEAKLIKWDGLATLLGFDAVYRLERLSGRYRDITEERTRPRTVHLLHEPGAIDAWRLAQGNAKWLSFIDARYGSATFLPMAPGALYQVTVSQTGLLARPLNQQARQAVGGWK